MRNKARHVLRRMVTAFVLAGASLLFGCSEKNAFNSVPFKFAFSAGPAQPAVAFTDVTKSAGLSDFRHETGAVGDKWLPESIGAGAGFFDYNRDGNLDVVLVSGGTWDGSQPAALRIYRNSGNGTFTEVTAEDGLSESAAYGMGVTAADYDNDGDTDLYLTALRENRLFRNNADGTFTEVSRKAGVAGAAMWSTAAAFFDADKDGYLDLYVSGYANWTPGGDLACALRGTTTLAYCSPEAYQGITDRFYHNNGDGTFSDWTDRTGLGLIPGKTLGAITLDHNDDGWPDLIVANDTDRNLLYVNQGDGSFREEGTASGIAYGAGGQARSGMGVAVGKVDGSGEPTLFVGNFSTEFIGVYRHAGSGLFADQAAQSGIGRPSLPTSTFGMCLLDIDFDSDLDLFAANGHIQEHIGETREGVAYQQPPQLFRGDGSGRFTVFDPAPSHALADSLVARGAACGDYDGDGDLDMLVTENDGPAHLWRNDLRENASQGKAHFLRVSLRGRGSNRNGIGARLSVVASSGRQERRVHGGGSYLSQSERTVTFGLGAAARVDTLRVEWPSGKENRFVDVAADQEVLAVEGQEALQPPASAATPETLATQ